MTPRRQKIAVIGYGNQGRAQAACLRDSGFPVIIGARKGKSFRAARRDGFCVLNVPRAVRSSDVVCVLLPDMAQKAVYARSIGPCLVRGQTLVFAHGFCVAFGLIKPPGFVDVVLLAPKATGRQLRASFLDGTGTPGAYGVHRDASGSAKKTALSLARALRIRSPVRCTFAQEARANLFAEQAVTIGGLLGIIRAGYDTMVSRGVPPELAYHECVGVTKLIADMLARDGLKAAIRGVSETAGYGALTRGGRVVTPAVKREMEKIFGEIESGEFAREWCAEHAAGMKEFAKLKQAAARHPLQTVGEKTRRARR